MESFLILALIVLLGWLVAHTLSCGSDLREIQKKVLPLALAIPRLEKQIKELKDEILALQKKPESKPVMATPVPAQPPHLPGTTEQLPVVTERTPAAVDVGRTIPVAPLVIKKEQIDLPPSVTPAQVPPPIVAPIAPPAAIPSPAVPQAKAAEPARP
jgi:hypothetical protein